MGHPPASTQDGTTRTVPTAGDTSNIGERTDIGVVEAAGTAAAPIRTTNARKKYPNKQIGERSEYIPFIFGLDTDIKQFGSFLLR
jgi:hypothetical protein